MLLGLRGAADLREHEAEVVVRVGELGRGGADPAQLGDREVGLAEVLEQVGEVVAGLGLRRVVLERALVELAGLFELALAIDQVAEVRQRGGHVRLEIDRLAEQVLGGLRSRRDPRRRTPRRSGGTRSCRRSPRSAMSSTGARRARGSTRGIARTSATCSPKRRHVERHHDLAADRLERDVVGERDDRLAVAAHAQLRVRDGCRRAAPS